VHVLRPACRPPSRREASAWLAQRRLGHGCGSAAGGRGGRAAAPGAAASAAAGRSVPAGAPGVTGGWEGPLARSGDCCLCSCAAADKHVPGTPTLTWTCHEW
jgi:hypothetical protein